MEEKVRFGKRFLSHVDTSIRSRDISFQKLKCSFIDVTYFFSWKWVVNSKKKADSASAAELCIGLPLGIGQCGMCERERKVNRRKLWFTSTCDISKTVARIEIKQKAF